MCGLLKRRSNKKENNEKEDALVGHGGQRVPSFLIHLWTKGRFGPFRNFDFFFERNRLNRETLASLNSRVDSSAWPDNQPRTRRGVF
jgi:hypothetical protein